jgi:hypothetical protein
MVRRQNGGMARRRRGSVITKRKPGFINGATLVCALSSAPSSALPPGAFAADDLLANRPAFSPAEQQAARPGLVDGPCGP